MTFEAAQGADTSQTHVMNVLVTAGIATAVTTAAALVVSKLETRHAAAALNATSHILWGDKAARQNALDWEHTGVGGLLNAGAMGAWAVVQELLPRSNTAWGAAAKGALVSGLAYATDYYLVPKRLTPGFEKRLSSRGMLIMYGLLAAGLGFGELLSRKRA